MLFDYLVISQIVPTNPAAPVRERHMSSNAAKRRSRAQFRGSGPLGRFVYVANLDSNTVSAYRIGPHGNLTPVAGSPFSSATKFKSLAFVDTHEQPAKCFRASSAQEAELSLIVLDYGRNLVAQDGYFISTNFILFASGSTIRCSVLELRIQRKRISLS